MRRPCHWRIPLLLVHGLISFLNELRCIFLCEVYFTSQYCLKRDTVPNEYRGKSRGVWYPSYMKRRPTTSRTVSLNLSGDIILVNIKLVFQISINVSKQTRILRPQYPYSTKSLTKGNLHSCFILSTLELRSRNFFRFGWRWISCR